MTVRVVLRVLGEPAPQGSKSKMPNGAMVEAASATGRQKLRAWRDAVAHEAFNVAAETGALFDGPVIVEAIFRFHMPKSRPAPVRQRGVGWKATKPDLDKLQRSTGDGLTVGGLIARDEQIVGWHTSKVELVEGWTGASIVVRDADLGELLL